LLERTWKQTAAADAEGRPVGEAELGAGAVGRSLAAGRLRLGKAGKVAATETASAGSTVAMGPLVGTAQSLEVDGVGGGGGVERPSSGRPCRSAGAVHPCDTARSSDRDLPSASEQAGKLN